MKKIFKYTLKFEDVLLVEMPKNAVVRHFGNQNEKPCIWAEVDTSQPIEKRIFYMFGTGHGMHNPSDLTYIGTAQFMSGSLVFHLYE